MKAWNRSTLARLQLVRCVVVAIVFGLFALPAAAEDLAPDDFRVFCGYLDALERPEIKKLKAKQRDARIARMAKMSVEKLRASVQRVKAVGATCDEVGKLFEERAKAAIQKAMPGRIALFVLDWGDPSHVVAAVTWKGIDKSKLVQEASLLAKVLADEAPIVTTIAVRGVDPRVKDPASDEAMWFEAKISRTRALRIDKDRIADFADRRYIRLFDGVVQK